MLRTLAAPLRAATLRRPPHVHMLQSSAARGLASSAPVLKRSRSRTKMNTHDKAMRQVNVDIAQIRELAERLDKADPTGGPGASGSVMPETAFISPPAEELDAFAEALTEPAPLTELQIAQMDRIQQHRMRIAAQNVPQLFSSAFRQKALGRADRDNLISSVRSLAYRLANAPPTSSTVDGPTISSIEPTTIEGTATSTPVLLEPIVTLQAKAGLKDRLLAAEQSLPPPLVVPSIPDSSLPAEEKKAMYKARKRAVKDHNEHVSRVLEPENVPDDFQVPLSSNDIILSLLTRLRDTAAGIPGPDGVVSIPLSDVVTAKELRALSVMATLEHNTDGVKALVQVAHMMDQTHYSHVTSEQAKQEASRVAAARQGAVPGMEYIKSAPPDADGRTDPAATYALARTEMADGIGRLLAPQGRLEMLRAVYREIVDTGVEMTGSMKHWLIRAQVESGDITGAVTALTDLEESSPAEMRTYAAVIVTLFKKDDIASIREAWSLYQQMRLAAHPVPDEKMYTRMILACASGKIPEQNPHNWRKAAGERAMDLFKEMSMTYDVRPSINTYNAVIHALSRDHEFANDAMAVYRQLIELQFTRPVEESVESGETGLEFVPDRSTFNNLLEAFDGNGDLARGKWVMGEMLRVAHAFINPRTAPQHRSREQNLVDAVSRLPDSKTVSLLFHCYAHYNPPLEPLLQEAREAAMLREREELSRLERGLSPDEEEAVEPPDDFEPELPPTMRIKEYRALKAQKLTGVQDMETAAGLPQEAEDALPPVAADTSVRPGVEQVAAGVYDLAEDAEATRDETEAQKAEKERVSAELERKRADVMERIDRAQDRKDELGGIIVPDKPGMSIEEKAEKVAEHVLRMAEAQRTAQLESTAHVPDDVAEGVTLPQTSAGVLRETSAILGSLMESATGRRNLGEMTANGKLDAWIAAKVDHDVLAAYLRVIMSHGAPEQVLWTINAAMFSPKLEENLYTRANIEPDKRAYEWLFRTGIYYDETDPLRPQVDRLLDEGWAKFVQTPMYRDPAAYGVWRYRIETLARSFRLDEAMVTFKQFVLTLPPITTDVINGKLPLDGQGTPDRLRKPRMRELIHQLSTQKRYTFPKGDFEHLRNRLALTYRSDDVNLVKHTQAVYQMQLGHLLRATNASRSQAPPMPKTRVGGLSPIVEDEQRKAAVKRRQTNWQAKAARRQRKRAFKSSKH